MTDASQFLYSSLREKVLEHLFVGELLKCLWRQGRRDIELLRAEVDAAGYDLAMECNGVLRHIQLKASHRNAKTRQVGINVALAAKPSGCVVWLRFDPQTLDLGPYLWFGGAPGEALPPLGDRIGRHTKADSTGVKAERSAIRILTRAQFSTLENVDEVSVSLFGV